MHVLFPNFKFPNQRWRYDGCTSYGKDMLYRGLSHVIVRTFTEQEKFEAYGTHFYLKENAITTATIEKVKHADEEKYYYYVFASKDEILAKRQELCPNIEVAETQ